MTSMTSDILYFPHIEFADPTWLKTSLCIWDHVYRIVPADYVPQDDVFTKQCADAGLVRNVQLSPADLSDAATEFETFWKALDVHPDAFVLDDMSLLHNQKIHQRLRDLFADYAADRDEEDATWLGIPRSIAHSYMFYLAESVAAKRGLRKLTDEKDVFAIAPFYDCGGRMDEHVWNEDVQDCQASLVIPACAPDGVAHLNFQDLIELRKRFEHDRQRFRGVVDAFTIQLSDVADEEHARQLAEDFRVGLQDIKHFTGLGRLFAPSEAVPAVLSVGIPTTLTALGTFMTTGAPFGVGQIAGCALIGFIASMSHSYARAKDAAALDPRSYWLGMNQACAHAMAARRPNRDNYFNEVFEEFMCD